MKKLNAWLVILSSVILGLHAVKVINILEGVGIWVLIIVVFLIGLNQLLRK
ncbi:MAG: hypothetical protein KJ646_01540 [Nanoarchaeota archaeon]|nr:hypothetical protein [Nanoarchaeota archaeon]MBU4116926.1 hypothetical protein [Nanoarchaeota archaeon]